MGRIVDSIDGCILYLYGCVQYVCVVERIPVSYVDMTHDMSMGHVYCMNIQNKYYMISIMTPRLDTIGILDR